MSGRCEEPIAPLSAASCKCWINNTCHMSVSLATPQPGLAAPPWPRAPSAPRPLHARVRPCLCRTCFPAAPLSPLLPALPPALSAGCSARLLPGSSSCFQASPSSCSVSAGSLPPHGPGHIPNHPVGLLLPPPTSCHRPTGPSSLCGPRTPPPKEGLYLLCQSWAPLPWAPLLPRAQGAAAALSAGSGEPLQGQS